MTPEKLKEYKEKLGMEIEREKHSPGLLSGLATFANTLPERKRHAAGLLAKFNNPTTAAAAEETKAFLKKRSS